MTLSSALRTKNARSKNFRNHFILLCVLTPVLAAVCVLLGVFTSPANPVFIAVLVLSAVFFTIGTAYCTMEYRSLVRFSRLCADEKYPCVFLSEYKNLEFFAADEESVRAYAELELKAYTALYKESGRHGARPVSDAERVGGVSGAPSAPDEWACAHALEALSSADAQLSQRSAAVRAYVSAFAAAPLSADAEAPVEVPRAITASFDQPLLVFPVFLATSERADQAVRDVCTAGFYARPWYRPLLYPGAVDAAAYRLPERGALPVTERCSAGAVTLPTDVSSEDAARIAEIVIRAAGRQGPS